MSDSLLKGAPRFARRWRISFEQFTATCELFSKAETVTFHVSWKVAKVMRKCYCVTVGKLGPSAGPACGRHPTHGSVTAGADRHYQLENLSTAIWNQRTGAYRPRCAKLRISSQRPAPPCPVGSTIRGAPAICRRAAMIAHAQPDPWRKRKATCTQVL